MRCLMKTLIIICAISVFMIVGGFLSNLDISTLIAVIFVVVFLWTLFAIWMEGSILESLGNQTSIKKKVPNYTREQLTALALAVNIASLSYETQVDIIQELADENPIFKNKTKNQLMSKLAFLSNAGATKQVDGTPLYVHDVHDEHSARISKSELCELVAEILEVESDAIESLQSATKPTILLILAGLIVNMVEKPDIAEKKVPNYTIEQLTALALAVNIASLSYEAQADIIQELADENPLFKNKTKNQLMSKLAFLSNSGVKKSVDNTPIYVHTVYRIKKTWYTALCSFFKNEASPNEATGKPVSKSELCEAVAKKLQIESYVIESLQSATKPVMLLILANLPTVSE